MRRVDAAQGRGRQERGVSEGAGLTYLSGRGSSIDMQQWDCLLEEGEGREGGQTTDHSRDVTTPSALTSLGRALNLPLPIPPGASTEAPNRA